jgi:hypothetical protein
LDGRWCQLPAGNHVPKFVKGLQDSTASLEKDLAKHEFPDMLADARHLCDAVLPAMSTVRGYADALEGCLRKTNVHGMTDRDRGSDAVVDRRMAKCSGNTFHQRQAPATPVCLFKK